MSPPAFFEPLPKPLDVTRSVDDHARENPTVGSSGRQLRKGGVSEQIRHGGPVGVGHGFVEVLAGFAPPNEIRLFVGKYAQFDQRVAHPAFDFGIVWCVVRVPDPTRRIGRGPGHRPIGEDARAGAGFLEQDPRRESDDSCPDHSYIHAGRLSDLTTQAGEMLGVARAASYFGGIRWQSKRVNC